METVVRPARVVSIPVVIGGVITTVLTLVLSYWLSVRFGFNAMGLYGWYILPFGALLVGLIAGSGYGIASWLTGFRIGKGTLWVILALQVLAYGLAQVAEYNALASTGMPLPAFVPYFDGVTRDIRFEDDNGVVGQPLGTLGYGVRLLELIGFVGGALLIPAGIRTKPYCETCGRYMKTRTLGALPASVKDRRMWRKADEEKAAYAAEQETALAQGEAVHNHLFELAEAGNAPAFADAATLLKAGTKEANTLPVRFVVQMSGCPTCRRGVLSSQVASGQGRNVSMSALAAVPVAPEVVRALDA
ncbi:MAG TPA: hypothetical protein VF594_00620 [Rubricoccaceae bacterium]|jgi:hypothetical protein